MDHDFKNFPELTNAQLAAYVYSPHPQITSDIRVTVVKVLDGDTILVSWEERDFLFRVRLLDVDTPELDEDRGQDAKDFLANRILDEDVWLRINRRNRVDKWGRLLAVVEFMGLNLNELMVNMGQAKPFSQRNEGRIWPIDKILVNK